MKAYMILLLFLAAFVVLFPVAFTYFTDLKVWKATMLHLDEFVFDHTGKIANLSVFNLLDENGDIIIQANLFHNDKDVAIFDKNGDIVASSFNTFFSKKAYEYLYVKIPQDKLPHPPVNKKEELLNRLDNMNKNYENQED